METTSKNIWQVAAGDTNRNYVDLCLKWDVIIVGPGSLGVWPECIPGLKEEGWSSKKISDVRRFCEEIRDGDIVVLRLGTSEIYGVGTVIGGYEWRDVFSDVDGWDLQHVRRVKWLWKGVDTPKQFDTYTLKWGDTVQIINQGPVTDWLSELSVAQADKDRSLIDIPSLPPGDQEEVNFEIISEYLFDKGVASPSIQGLIAEIGELIRIAKWYQKFGNPSEHETVAYLVVPILRALGWTPQRMAIEWKNVDIALFNKLPREDENLSVVVEAKQKDYSCLNAKSQAQYYAEQSGRDACQRLIVTDGLRYGIYLRKNGIFTSTPEAYLNLTHMRASYPILECDGTKETLYLMSPDWTH